MAKLTRRRTIIIREITDRKGGRNEEDRENVYLNKGILGWIVGVATKRDRKKMIQAKKQIIDYDFDFDYRKAGWGVSRWKEIKKKIKIKLAFLKREKTKDPSELITNKQGDKNKQRNIYSLNPDNTLLLIWNFSINCIYIVSFVIIPFVMINPKELLPPIRWLEFSFDIIFFTDIVIDCFTAYHNNEELITDLKQIWMNYLSSFFILSNIIFDILSIFPGLITGEAYYQIYYLKVLRYVQFTRLIDLLGVAINRARNKILMKLSKVLIEAIITLLKALILMALLIHIFSCIWINLGDNSSIGWMKTKGDFGDSNNKYSDSYIPAIYFIVTTFTTVGYGEFSPGSNYEMIFVMIMELLGLAIFSYGLGTISSFEKGSTSEQIIEQK